MADFNKLMDSVEDFFNKWMEDETIQEYYFGNKQAIQKEFISCIQVAIKSEFIVLTQDELMNENRKFHNSMEGLDY